MVPRDQAVSAEIRYSLEVLKRKYSYRFGESKSKLSCSLFPDSKVTLVEKQSADIYCVMAWHLL